MELSCGSQGSTGLEIVTQINANTEDIEELQAGGKFNNVQEADINDIGLTPVSIGFLSVDPLPMGKYKINLSNRFFLDDMTNAAIVGYAINSGVPIELGAPHATTTVPQPFNYSFVHEQLVAGPFSLQVTMSKSVDANVLDCLASDIWIEAVLV